MTHFQNITSLAELKKQYRVLALANHPDRGGSTEIMQEINAQFERLFQTWEKDTTVSQAATGYENDYSGSTARQYGEYVYNEYRWTGSNYQGQDVRDIIVIIRKWLKDTYPSYKFSVRRDGYNSFYIDLLTADFECFRQDSPRKHYKRVNHYWIDQDTEITDRAKEVMKNIRSFVLSYNYDDSDAMVDYFDTNFYLNLGIGNHEKAYKCEPLRLKGKKGDKSNGFNHPEGPAHKAIRQALDKAKFAEFDSRRHGRIIVLGKESLWENGETHFYPLDYSSAIQGQKRMGRLIAAGIQCRLTGRNGGMIAFEGYADQTQAALDRERMEYIEAKRAWDLRVTGSAAA